MPALSSSMYSATASPLNSAHACCATTSTSSAGSSARPAEVDMSFSALSRRASTPRIPTSGACADLSLGYSIRDDRPVTLALCQAERALRQLNDRAERAARRQEGFLPVRVAVV